MLALVTVVDDGGDARRVPKGRQFGFSEFLKAFGTINIINIDVFGASQAKNHVFWTAPSNSTGIYHFFIMLREVFVPCKSHKTLVNHSVWGLL